MNVLRYVRATNKTVFSTKINILRSYLNQNWAGHLFCEDTLPVSDASST